MIWKAFLATLMCSSCLENRCLHGSWCAGKEGWWWSARKFFFMPFLSEQVTPLKKYHVLPRMTKVNDVTGKTLGGGGGLWVSLLMSYLSAALVSTGEEKFKPSYYKKGCNKCVLSKFSSTHIAPFMWIAEVCAVRWCSANMCTLGVKCYSSTSTNSWCEMWYGDSTGTGTLHLRQL